MNDIKTTPKDFFLWAGAMIAFYWSIIAYIFLVFSYINYALPNALAYYPSNPYESGISGEMASVIVMLPLYLLLMRVIRGTIAQDPSREEVWVRRWALILTLFVAGLAIAADLVTLLTTFLNGEELTTAFLLKVLVVLVVAAGVFLHFISDLRGYWTRFPMRKNIVSVIVALIAVGTIIAGFFIIGTPMQARLSRFDAQKVQDLQNIQSQVLNYWQAKHTLPKTLNDLKDSLSYASIPLDAQTKQPYTYEPTGNLSFELCAVFNRESHADQYKPTVMPMGAWTKGTTDDNWDHGSGQVCFARTIDPSFYPSNP